MANLKEIALELAITATIADAAKTHKDYLRDELAQALDEIGAEATRAELNGEKIAKVSMVSPSAKPYVANEQSFIAYVEANFPQEIVQKVRESFWTAFQARLVPTDDGRAIDKETGELVDGLSFRQSTPYVSTRFEKEGRDKILDAIRNGRLSLDLTERKQLTEGTTE